MGIEIHAQLQTKTKLFSGSRAAFEQGMPNSQVSFFDAALPGTLPVLNTMCVEQAIRSALSLQAQVHARSTFERKHYFYADLPLGYQVTQQDACIATNGTLNITVPKTRDNSQRFDVYQRDVRITRLQLEQDSGKSMHDFDPKHSMIDLNRAGCALVEIVSEPDIRSSDEAACYVRKIQRLLRHVGTCDGNMEEGSLRCDVNISVRRLGGGGSGDSGSGGSGGSGSGDSNGDELLVPLGPMGERVEIKNLNSIRSVVRAIDYEVERQIHGEEMDNAPVTRHETRTFDVSKGVSVRMRSKESAPDYRFLLDPDLPPLVLENGRVENIAASLPELPDAIRLRLMKQYGLSLYDANVIVDIPDAAEYYEDVLRAMSKSGTEVSKQTLNWVTNELLGRMKTESVEFSDLGSGKYSGLKPADISIMMVSLLAGDISGKIAKTALDLTFEEKGVSPMEIVEREGWSVVRDVDALMNLCQQAVENPKNSKQVSDVQSGDKPKLLGFFVGQVMKASNGQADPATVRRLLQELLGLV